MPRTSFALITCCLAVGLAAGLPQQAHADTLYVDNDATAGLNNGSSWQNAYLKLSDAITNARNTDFTGEIRVAVGTYTPGTARGDVIQLTNDVTILGGFRGLLPGGDHNDRDIRAFETTLTGDIGTPGDDSDNSYHVVYSGADNITGILDGFTITKGNDNRGNPWGHGGVFLQDGNATLRNCVIIQNRATTEGGGVFCTYCSATLINCQILGNYAPSEGGALWAGGSNINLINCIFNGNQGQHGGGLMIKSNSTATITNCTITYNTATGIAGAIYNEGTDNCNLANSIIWGNSASSTPDQLYGDLAITYSRLPSVTPGEGNIIADPLLIDPDGPDDVFGTIDDDLRLQFNSPCANTANENLLPPEIIHDYEGDDRIQDCALDMGADESPHWTTDCNSNAIDDDCEIASDTSQDCNTNNIPDGCEPAGLQDCNSNDVPDLCDIFGPTCSDCNDNFIPDECEPGYLEDCNNNGVPDFCDIAGPTASDCNLNAVPDECDLQFGTSTDCQSDGIPDDCQVSTAGILNIEISTGSDADNLTWEFTCDGQLIASDGPFPNNTQIATSIDVPPGAICKFFISDTTRQAINDDVQFAVSFNDVPLCSGTDFGCHMTCLLSTTNDCNTNGIPDDCDIAAGTSVSTDGDLIPDECEPVLNATKNSRHFTIDSAVDASSNGDEILIEPGTYNELINLRRKMLTLRATDQPDDTILDGKHEGPIIHGFSNTHPTVISGITIANGFAKDGGGIMAKDAFHLQLEHCVFRTNGAVYTGGTVCASQSTINISECLFMNNSVYGISGGGVYCEYSDLTIKDCLFDRNSSGFCGGALSCYCSHAIVQDCSFRMNSVAGNGAREGGAISFYSGDQTVMNCQFVNNYAVSTGSIVYARGGGISADSSNTVVCNCLFLGNSATMVNEVSNTNGYGAGVYLDHGNALINCIFNGNTASRRGGAAYVARNCTIDNCTFYNNQAGNSAGALFADDDYGQAACFSHCIFWKNQASEFPQIDANNRIVGTYSCVQGGFPGKGNIDADPLFIDPDGPDGIPGTIDDDLRLMPSASPCIDAGSNGLLPADTLDLDNDTDTQEPLPIDLHRNPRISDDTTRPDTGVGNSPMVDLGAYELQSTATHIGDLDHDGDVDLDDFVILQGYFTGPESIR